MAHLIPWSKLLEDREFCDMHILSQDGEKIPAHKLILGAQSQFIKEAINSHQPSEGEFIVEVDHPANIIRHVVRAIYSGRFGPLDEPSTIVKQENHFGSTGRSGSVNEGPDDYHHPHHMMFYAQVVNLIQDLRLFSPKLRAQATTALKSISHRNINHADFPVVVEYDLDFNYAGGFTSSGIPWFGVHYKNHPHIREVLDPILLKHPEALAALCKLLAKALDSTASEFSGPSTTPSFIHLYEPEPQLGSKRRRD